MNKIQKIIISIWFILSFFAIYFAVAVLLDNGGTYLLNTVGGLFFGLIVIGIPTLFLYKLWTDKK